MKSDIVLAGVGGQGILTIATILGGAALADNLFLKQAEVHGMSQRGGDVQSNLRLSSDPIFAHLIPLGGADLIVSLEPMEALRYIQFLSAEGWIVTNSAPFVNIDNYPEMESIQQELAKHPNVVSFDMDELAKEVASARSSNLVLLGAASPFIDMSVDKIEAAVRNLFAPKGEKIVDANIAAFRAGRQRALQIAGR